MSASSDPAHENRLAGATSPYLLQHKHNPVDWWPWGPDALGRGQAQQPADSAVGRLRRLPLVPRDGARELRGRRNREGDERAVRQHQSRSRGAARHRPDLHERAAFTGRAGRLAADHVSDAERRAGVGRHLFPQRSRASAGRLSPTCCARWRGCFARSRRRSSRTAPRCWRGSPTRRGRRARSSSASRSSTRRRRRSATCSIPSTAVCAARPNFRKPRFSNCSGAPGRAAATRVSSRRSSTRSSIWRGRHLRSSRRRLLALFGRRALAGAAFREDALRQCPAPRIAGAGLAAQRQTAVRRARAGNRRLAQAGNDHGGRGLRGLARCRFGRRRGQVLRLVADGNPPGLGRPMPTILPQHLRRERRRQLRGSQYPQPPQVLTAQHGTRRGAGAAPRRSKTDAARISMLRGKLLEYGRNASGPGSTTRCWRTGTG